MKESTENAIRGIILLGPPFWFGFSNLIGILNEPSRLTIALAKGDIFLAYALAGGFLIGAVIGVLLWTIMYFVLKVTGKDVKYWRVRHREDHNGSRK